MFIDFATCGIFFFFIFWIIFEDYKTKILFFKQVKLNELKGTVLFCLFKHGYGLSISEIYHTLPIICSEEQIKDILLVLENEKKVTRCRASRDMGGEVIDLFQYNEFFSEKKENKWKA